jgi:hypothetical protein
MAAIDVSVPHQLGLAEARSRVERFLESVERDFADYVKDVEGKWTGNELAFAFKTAGIGIHGTLRVEESLVYVHVPIPLVAALFRGRIEKSITDELKKLVHSPGGAAPKA